MAMKRLTVTIVMEFDPDDQPELETSTCQAQLADIAETQVRSRLFGDGFLPSEIEVCSYTVNAEWGV